MMGSPAPAPKALFGDLPLPDVITKQLRESRFTAPTPIQEAAAMPIYRGSHSLLHAETGSGKTLAYLLPLLSRAHVSRPNQLLILVPSRELALQTAAVIERFWPHHGTCRAFVLAGSQPAEQQAQALAIQACPVIVSTPQAALRLVRHLAGTDRLHSRRAISASGAALVKLANGLRAVVLDEADALLVSRELAIGGPPRRKSYKKISGGSGDVKAPERFSQPAARVVQALAKARTVAGSPRGPRWRGDRDVASSPGRGGRSVRSGRGGAGKGGDMRGELQLVALSATASYRLREELGRLLALERGEEIAVITPEPPTKRTNGQRGLGGVGVPATIVHSWVPCASEAEKPRVLAHVLRVLQPCGALLFLPDDAPLRRTIEALRACGVDAVALHEAMGLQAGDAHASGYSALVDELTADASGGGRRVAAVAPVADSAADLPRDVVGEGEAVAAPVAAVPESSGPAARGGRAEEGGRLLVSTFGSSRGLDLPAVDSVLLFSLPDSADQYLHVAGRTGRQGRIGRVFSLLTAQEVSGVGTLTRQLGISIKPDPELALALAALSD